MENCGSGTCTWTSSTKRRTPTTWGSPAAPSLPTSWAVGASVSESHCNEPFGSFHILALQTFDQNPLGLIINIAQRQDGKWFNNWSLYTRAALSVSNIINILFWSAQFIGFYRSTLWATLTFHMKTDLLFLWHKMFFLCVSFYLSFRWQMCAVSTGILWSRQSPKDLGHKHFLRRSGFFKIHKYIHKYSRYLHTYIRRHIQAHTPSYKCTNIHKIFYDFSLSLSDNYNFF